MPAFTEKTSACVCEIQDVSITFKISQHFLACCIKWWFGIHKQHGIGILSSILYLLSSVEQKKTTVRGKRLFSLSPHYGMWQPLFYSALTNLMHKEGSGFVFEVLDVFTWGRRLGKHPRLPRCCTVGSRGHEVPPSSNTEEFLHRCWFVVLKSGNKEASWALTGFRWLELPASNAALSCHVVVCLPGVFKTGICQSQETILVK